MFQLFILRRQANETETIQLRNGFCHEPCHLGANHIGGEGVMKKPFADDIHKYVTACASFRERILREALPLWVSEEEPSLVERSLCGLGVEILGLTARGHDKVYVEYHAILEVRVS